MIGNICNVIAAAGNTSIELFEWSQLNIKKKRLANKPSWSTYGRSAGAMALTGIRLAHAVVKADYLIARNYALPSLGFLLQMDRIIDFSSTSNLRLFPGASSILNDVTQSSVVGRVGQGLSLLFAESRGYNFVGHLASDSSVVAHLSTAAARERVADFLFEDSFNERMILESKATFSLLSNECTPVKTVLKKALIEQVDEWMRIVTPSPKKGYALYSCLRETGNPTASAIVFVDPPERRGDFNIELPADWVRRHNYAAWLRLMGLPDAADRLRAQPEWHKVDHTPTTVRFSIVDIGGREFAVRTARGRTKHLPHSLFVIGLEVNALRAISAAIGGSADELKAHSGQPGPQFDQASRLSIFRDGTVFGLVDLRSFKGNREFFL